MIAADILSPLMFITLFLLIFLNVPVAFSLYLTAIIFGLICWGPNSLDIVFNATWKMMNNWALVAVPLFVFMAALMEKARLADDMFKSLYYWLGRIRGSLLVISLLLGFAIGAMSGVSAAGVSTLALMIYPLMLKYKYPRKISIGCILYAGSLPQLVPPSLLMIYYGIATGTSIGKLFAGGIGMGILMTVLGIAYVIIWSQLHKDEVPILEESIPLREKLVSLKGLVGPLAIIIGVLGSIFTGVATPTEAAGIGTFLTLIYALVRRRLTKEVLRGSLLDTVKITTMVGWMTAGAMAYTSIFSGIGGREWIKGVLLSLPNARVTTLILSLAFIFFLGMFLDPGPVALVVGPLLSPIMEAVGYDPIWWGIIFCSMLVPSYITPPVGYSMYYFKGIRPEVPMSEIYRSTGPFIILSVLTIVLGVIFPDIPLFFVKLLT